MSSEMLPAEPFSKWIRHLCSVYGEQGTADLTGMHVRQVYKFRKLIDYTHGKQRPIHRVHLRIVDQAMTNADTDMLLQDVYPEVMA